MTRTLSLLLVLSILVIGVFGITLMNHGTGAANGCIASPIDRTPCPENGVAMSVHHIRAFISLFSAAPSIPFIFSLAPLLALFLSIGYFFLKQEDFVLPNQTFWRVGRDPRRQSVRSRKMTRWLSLLQNSPSMHRFSSIKVNLINLCKQKNLRTVKTIN